MIEEGSERMAYMVGNCPNHGLVADDAIDREFPNTVYCDSCGQELEKCIAAPAGHVEKNDDVTMKFEE